MDIVGVFNPGAAELNGKVILLTRVAERPRKAPDGYTALPRMDSAKGLVVDMARDEELELVDARVVRIKATGEVRLTFISHLRVFYCGDGRFVEGSESARFFPQTFYESYGVEDPRITQLNDQYWITYVAVSKHGACTALASTEDFKEFKRHGIIFPVENKDVVLFPELVNERAAALHRPNGATPFTAPEMWLASSPDLHTWGVHVPLQIGSGSDWDASRVGAGAPPIAVKSGWLEIYHGNQKGQSQGDVGRYAAGAVVLDRNYPQRVVRKSTGPIFVPEEDFEREGFVPNVVFPTGIIRRDDKLLVYYGAADESTGVVEFKLADVITATKKV